MRQRAERLMLIKTAPLEKLDRKLFAKGVVPAVSLVHAWAYACLLTKRILL